MAQTSEVSKYECPFCEREMARQEYEEAVKKNQLKMNQQRVAERKRMEQEMQEKIADSDAQAAGSS